MTALKTAQHYQSLSPLLRDVANGIAGLDSSGNLKASQAGLVGSKSQTWASVADGAVANTTVTVTGAAIGDFVSVSNSVVVPANATLTGQVTAANTVSVTLFNKTGSPLVLGASTLKALVVKAV